MTAQPLEIGPAPVPRTYDSISALLPEGMLADFTTAFHSADVFSAARVLEYWGRIADTLADPATYAALDRTRPTEDGPTLDELLAEADR
ncbi:hypothetical protein ACFWNL_18155 [Kitasatospora sp. NPDC058397]|uniref:hypothetical protein n=1 Tax=unclassified Kitasatospora TaxID=2633591 RepID=UPI003657195D